MHSKDIIPQKIPLRLITTYGAQWNQVKNILQKHWGILSRSPILTDIVGPRPQLVARRVRNHKDTLVHAEYTRGKTMNWLIDLPPPPKGMYACGHCQMCGFVEKTAVFTDRRIGMLIFALINFSIVRLPEWSTCWNVHANNTTLVKETTLYSHWGTLEEYKELH